MDSGRVTVVRPNEVSKGLYFVSFRCVLAKNEAKQSKTKHSVLDYLYCDMTWHDMT